MKYIFILLVFLSCNSNRASKEISYDPALDTLIKNTDSSIADLMKLDTLTYQAIVDVEKNTNEIKQLRQDKLELINQLEQKYPNFQAIQSNDVQYKRINELNKLLLQKEFENAQLKKQIRKDSTVKTRIPIGSKLMRLIEQEPILPSNNSIAVTLQGQYADLGISVWIMPYSKKAKKAMHNYDLFCNESKGKFASFKAVQAIYYEGRYIANDFPSGKYIIKVCAYYGDCLVVKKGNDLLEVNLKVQ